MTATERQLIGNISKDQFDATPIIGTELDGVRNGNNMEVAIIQVEDGELPLAPTNEELDELYLVLSGNVSIAVNGTEINLSENHYIVSTSGNRVEWKDSQHAQVLAIRFQRPQTEVLPAHPYVIHDASTYAPQNRDYIVGGFPDDPIANTLAVGVALKTLKPVASEVSHYHTGTTELCVVTDGQWQVEANGQPATLTTGDYVLSQPGSFLSWAIPESAQPVKVL